MVHAGVGWWGRDENVPCCVEYNGRFKDCRKPYTCTPKYLNLSEGIDVSLLICLSASVCR